MSTQQFNLMAQHQFTKLRYPFAITQIELEDNISVAYADEGKKDNEAILFIHGLGSYAPAWKYNVSELSKNYRCIVVDLPGYGKSSKGQYEADMSFHAKYLFHLMKKLKINEFHIAGHSMGGQIAINMGLDNSKKVKSLLLMAPAGIETFTEEEMKVFEKTTTVDNLAAVSDEQYKINLSLNFYKMDERAQFMYDDRMIIKSDPQIMDYYHMIARGVMGMLKEPVFNQLEDLEIPVLIVYGKQDRLIPNTYLHPNLSTEDIGELAKERIPDAQLEMIDEAGHFVHFEQAYKVNKIIINFLNNN